MFCKDLEPLMKNRLRCSTKCKFFHDTSICCNDKSRQRVIANPTMKTASGRRVTRLSTILPFGLTYLSCRNVGSGTKLSVLENSIDM